ncbi:MAG: glycosyltransferase family 4 protein [Chloroflexota bacterium]|nr:glycosyltransferase family 4 protein [Chloroflexota bacterium]
MNRFTKQILLIANWDWVIYNFRLPLARALENSGLKITLVCPPGDYTEELREQGFAWMPWHLERRSTQPWRELFSVVALYRLYRQLRPAAVHHFTIKPILYGSIAARAAKVPTVINNFTGLGYLFSQSQKATWLRKLILPLLHWALGRDGFHTAFQSRGDRDTLVDLGLIAKQETTVIPGTGVDLDRFHPPPPFLSQDWERKGGPRGDGEGAPPLVLMASRLLWDKGIAEYVEAARILHDEGLQARFWLAGAPDSGNLACVPEEKIAAWRQESRVEFLGHCADMPALMNQADIAVLPSYHEGVPLFLLEAAASGLPLVGTDIEGCRMVIEEGRNGFLVPKGDASALAAALKKMLADSDLRQRMGRESRQIAETNFSQEAILEQYLAMYRKLGVLGQLTASGDQTSVGC